MILFGIFAVGLLNFFGVFTHIFEEDFDQSFHYPYDGDISEFIAQLRNKEKPSVSPINIYNISFLSVGKKKCSVSEWGGLRLVYLVKSAVDHFEHRSAIRSTWGYEGRFSDVPIRTIFLLGVDPSRPELQDKLAEEQRKFGDVVQANFVDHYFNNTIKTMMGFKWVMENCLESQFYFFSDDDMYLSTRNVIRFLRNPSNYPEYLLAPLQHLDRLKRSVGRRSSLDYELPADVRLFSGFVFVSSPHRHYPSKWYVSLSEYKYDKWPPYVTAGAYVLSKNALIDMYYASMYTAHFRFDDIFLGIVAKKAGIEPYHCDEFNFYKKEYTPHSYRYVVASHGFAPDELRKVWAEQRSIGNA